MCIERSPYERGRVLFGATLGSDQPPPHPISVGQDSILEMIVGAELSQPSREKRGPCGRTPFSREMLFKFELRGIVRYTGENYSLLTSPTRTCVGQG